MQHVVTQVKQAVNDLTKRTEFRDWLKQQKLGEGLVLINNSFVYRDTKTTKSSFYLGIPISTAGKPDIERVAVTHGHDINSDLKFVAIKDKNFPPAEDLDVAIKRELKKLGSVVMVLVGEIDDSVKSSEEVGHKLFSEIVLDPTAKALLSVKGGVITIQSAADEEQLWVELQNIHGQPLPIDLMTPFATAVDKLRKREYAILRLPMPGAKLKDALLETFSRALQDTITEYDQSLHVSKGLPAPHTNEFNNLLRIAYNFASDAVPMIRLLISICDLKPVVRWCTTDEWFGLTDAFKNLPWSKLKHKPSLDTYQQTINAARNRAFHHLLPVNKTLQVELDGTTLGMFRLRLFSEYAARRSAEKFDYEDKILVDILTDFTRAGEKAVSAQFWHRNRAVMAATVDLLSRTSATLKLLGSA
jgi:hypothetical protein